MQSAAISYNVLVQQVKLAPVERMISGIKMLCSLLFYIV